ncbi:MAG: hypothetical protein WKG07_17575 [Hymenobacter sp.]
MGHCRHGGAGHRSWTCWTTSSVSVALQNIGGSLGASQDDVTWVIAGAAGGQGRDAAHGESSVHGHRAASRLFMLALVAYGVSSLLCGFSTPLGMLLVMRVFFRAGAAVLFRPLAQAEFLKIPFRPRSRGRPFALFGVATVVAPTAGPCSAAGLACGQLQLALGVFRSTCPSP